MYLDRYDLKDIASKRIVLFSYGSGLASSMYALRASDDIGRGSALERLWSSLTDLSDRLGSRQKVDPAEFEKIMKLREETHHLGELMFFLFIRQN